MTKLQTALFLAMLGGMADGGEPAGAGRPNHLDGVVLEFSSRSCGPCQAMAPIVRRLQQQGYAIRPVDIDRERALASRFRINRVPTTVLIIGGQERQRYVGYLGEDQLRRMARSIPDRPEPLRTTTTEPKPLPPKPPITRPAAFQPSGPTVPSVIRANIGDAPPPSASNDPLAVCVRIRVRDSRGLDVGSGTIIDSRPGRTVILTCGHIFRHYDSRGRIEVDVFGSGEPTGFDGKLIDHDLKSDVGLVSISTLHPLPASRLSAEPAGAGQHVFSIGCGGGDPPTRLQHLITSTTRYKSGYIECTGTPNQGRSGGGLFSTDGRVLGVCVLADPKARRGLYAALPAVEALLDRSSLGELMPSRALIASVTTTPEATQPEPLDEPPFEPALASTEIPPFEAPEPTARTSGPNLDATASSSRGIASGNPLSSQAAVPLPLKRIPVESVASSSEALLDSIPGISAAELRKQLEVARGAEVICIIRDRNNPQAKSRVVVIHKASDSFIADLTGELQRKLRPTTTIQPTSLNLPLPAPREHPNNATVHRPAQAVASPGLEPPVQRYRRQH